jgi:DNA-binding IclR family transcriptional regulator
MSKAEIPASVLQFILKRIETVTELETLLIMSAEERRDWSVQDIASLVYVAAPSAAAVLHALEQRKLVSSSEDGSRFRFSPSSDEERQVVLETAVAYRIHLVPIATLIHKKASVPVQEFARAFSLKKDD